MKKLTALCMLFFFVGQIVVAQQSKTKMDFTDFDKPTVLTGVSFAANSDKLLTSSFVALEQLIAQIKLVNKDVKIVGYSDNTGNAEFNSKLSKRRALAIRDYLAQHGIAAEHVFAFGKGDENPIGDNNTAEGRLLNRRIEVSFRK